MLGVYETLSSECVKQTTAIFKVQLHVVVVIVVVVVVVFVVVCCRMSLAHLI